MILLFQKRKRKRNRTKNKENENESDGTDRKLGKYTHDNIIKKVKSKLFNIIINFINRIVNKTNEESKKEIFKIIRPQIY